LQRPNPRNRRTHFDGERLAGISEIFAEYAAALAALKAGTGSQNDADIALAQLVKVTGESVVAPKTTAGPSPLTATLSVPSYAQYTNYYCGPATAQDILRFLGPTTSRTYDTVTHAYDVVNGNTSHDQPILANAFWLNTSPINGTYWGDPYMPLTLNNWHGSYWYQSTASGNLTQSQAWIDVDSDMNLNHPIAENVLYSASTYLPPGFPSGTYLHWDVIFGDNSSFQAGIAQPYGNPRTPYYWEPWATQYSAIHANHGIVW
jgi:hypothetical protein